MRLAAVVLLLFCVAAAPAKPKQFFKVDAILIGDLLGKSLEETKLQWIEATPKLTERYGFYEVSHISTSKFGYDAMGVRLEGGRIKNVTLSGRHSQRKADDVVKAAEKAGGVRSHKDTPRYLIGGNQRYYARPSSTPDRITVDIYAHPADWLIAEDELSGPVAAAMREGKIANGMTFAQVKASIGRPPDFSGTTSGIERHEWIETFFPGGPAKRKRSIELREDKVTDFSDVQFNR